MDARKDCRFSSVGKVLGVRKIVDKFKIENKTPEQKRRKKDDSED